MGVFDPFLLQVFPGSKHYNYKKNEICVFLIFILGKLLLNQLLCNFDVSVRSFSIVQQ